MTVNEIIVALEKMKAEDPERFYKALGYGDQGAGIMSRFVSGSYELGLVAGALWMQEQTVLQHGIIRARVEPSDPDLYRHRIFQVAVAVSESILQLVAEGRIEESDLRRPIERALHREIERIQGSFMKGGRG